MKPFRAITLTKVGPYKFEYFGELCWRDTREDGASGRWVPCDPRLQAVVEHLMGFGEGAGNSYLKSKADRDDRWNAAAHKALGINHPKYLEEQVAALRGLNTLLTKAVRKVHAWFKTPDVMMPPEVIEAVDAAFKASIMVPKPKRESKAIKVLERLLTELEEMVNDERTSAGELLGQIRGQIHRVRVVLKKFQEAKA